MIYFHIKLEIQVNNSFAVSACPARPSLSKEFSPHWTGRGEHADTYIFNFIQMVYFHIIYIEMQTSFVVHVSCFLCLGRNLGSEDQQNQHIIDFSPYEIPDPLSRSADFQTRFTSRSLHFILKGCFLIEQFSLFLPQANPWEIIDLSHW